MRGLSRDDCDATRSCATWPPPASRCCAVLRVEEPSPAFSGSAAGASYPLTAPPSPVARSFARRCNVELSVAPDRVIMCTSEQS